MFQGQSSCFIDSQSFGTTAIIACAVAIILTLTISVIITFIVTYMFVKRKHRTTATNVYDMVLPPTNQMELQPNPGYSTVDEVFVERDPAYETFPRLNM